jgi:hypothetical protein
MIADPRRREETAAAPHGAHALYRLAESSLAAATGQRSDADDAAIARSLDEALESGAGDWLTRVLAHAPSLSVERHLRRLLAERAALPPGHSAVGVRLFAIPVVIVAAAQARSTVACVLADPGKLAGILREHAALGGNRAFALANALCAADAIDVARLPALVRAVRDAQRADTAPIDVPPAPLAVDAQEGAHLRFLVGSALAAREAKLADERDTGRWGRPLAQALMDELRVGGVSLVALPRPPRPLPAAVAQGRAAQREAGAQLFASRALRELRASVGEPVAVISAHAAGDAASGGELRLSLSSPLSPRDAQGFRCALHPGERVGDVVAMLTDLLADCRVGDVRVLDGVHPDRDPLTGGRLLFKPGTLPPTAPLH